MQLFDLRKQLLELRKLFQLEQKNQNQKYTLIKIVYFINQFKNCKKLFTCHVANLFDYTFPSIAIAMIAIARYINSIKLQMLQPNHEISPYLILNGS